MYLTRPNDQRTVVYIHLLLQYECVDHILRYIGGPIHVLKFNMNFRQKRDLIFLFTNGAFF